MEMDRVRMDAEEIQRKEPAGSIDPDMDTVRQVLAGDREAFALIVSKYQRALFNLAYRHVGDGYEAEDLTQEIFVKAYSNLSGFGGRSRFFTWLYTIALNHLRSRHKPLKRILQGIQDFFSFERIASPDSPEDAVERRETMQILEEEILSLPEIYREAILLRDINELSYREICEILQIPMESVKTRIHRGRSLLCSRLQKRGFTR